jgi:hypothetical protein
MTNCNTLLGACSLKRSMISNLASARFGIPSLSQDDTLSWHVSFKSMCVYDAFNTPWMFFPILSCKGSARREQPLVHLHNFSRSLLEFPISSLRRLSQGHSFPLQNFDRISVVEASPIQPAHPYLMHKVTLCFRYHAVSVCRPCTPAHHDTRPPRKAK